MKLIEAMKRIKELQVKAADLRKKVGEHCAALDFETPVYKDQAKQIDEWVQGHTDVGKEILRLRYLIQKTNLATSVAIELGGVRVVKTIAEWIHRRRDLAAQDLSMWSALTDRGLRDQRVQPTPGGQVTDVKVRRYFDPATRDAMQALYRDEPLVIDRTLEVVNAVTDVID